MNPFVGITFASFDELRACSNVTSVYGVVLVTAGTNPALYFMSGTEGNGAADDGYKNIRDLARRTWTRTTLNAADVADFVESLDDRVAALLVAGAGITLSYDDAAGALTIVNTDHRFNYVADVLADTSMIYLNTAVGATVKAHRDFFRWIVAASDAVDQHVTTAGGLKLYVLPNEDGYYINAFGAIGDGATINTTALQKALDVAAGEVLRAKPGNYYTLALLPPSNTTFICTKGKVTLTMAGVDTGNLLAQTDKTGLTLRGLRFVGNNSGSATGNGAALRVYLSGAGAAHAENYNISNCHFENFRASVWVHFINDNITYQIKNPKVSNNTWKSLSGNCRDGVTLGVQSTCVAFSGLLNAAAYLEDIECDNNVADGTYIKRFVEFWNGCRAFSCQGNRLKNFGTDASIGVDSGNYAIMLYDSSLQTGLRSGVISSNVIDGFKSVGIYCAGASDTIFSHNTVLNGSATTEVSMPRGGIVIAAGWDILCSDNHIENMGTNGIRVLGVGAWTGTGSGHTTIINAVTVASNVIQGCATAVKLDGSGYAIGYVVGGLTLTDNRTSGFVVKDNSLSENTTGVKIQTFGPNIEDVSIVSNEIVSTIAGSRGIEFIVYGGGALGPAGFNNLDTLIQGNKINVAQYAMLLPTALGSVIVRENTCSGDFSARGIQATSCENIALLFNTFQNVTAAGQACYYTNASKGIHRGTAFLACDTNKISVGGTDMGRGIPGWTPVGRGAYVESLLQIEVGAVGVKYINEGWYWDSTAWREQRRFTGN